MLKITTASEPINVSRITMAIYGDPGVGKTTLAFSSDKPILFDFDNGAHRAMIRKDIVRVNSWADVANLSMSDLEPFNTIIIDTVGRMLDALQTEIIANDPKMGRGGVLTQQGWGVLKQRFSSWLKMLTHAGKDIVLIAHGTEKSDGETITARLDVQGGSKDEIYKSVDAMGRAFIKDGRRVLSFDPTESAFGKNPGQFELLAIPSPSGNDYDFLGGLISQIKDALNEQTAAMIEEAKKIDAWGARLKDFDSAGEFNDALTDAKKESRVIQKMLLDAAKRNGLEFDKTAKEFKTPTAEINDVAANANGD